MDFLGEVIGGNVIILIKFSFSLFFCQLSSINCQYEFVQILVFGAYINIGGLISYIWTLGKH